MIDKTDRDLLLKKLAQACTNASNDDTRLEFVAAASPEVVLSMIKELEEARDSVAFYQRRVELLQHWQPKMRDPERTIACDIIANGQTLPPEHAGNRYVIPEDTSQAKIAEQALEIQKLNGDIRQMAADLRAIQEIHDQQKARLHSENATWKSSLAALRQELEDSARKLEFAKKDIEKGRDMLDVACRERDALQAKWNESFLTPDVDSAHDLGAKGARPTESERLLFEAWMRGHCWAIVGTWNGREYDDRPEHREAKVLDPLAMQNRQLFAAWRDSAALRFCPDRQNESELISSAESQRPKG